MMTFRLNDNEEALYKAFCEKHRHLDVNKGAIGGSISVIFTMTGIGTMPSVKCGICGEKEDITDYDVL